MNASKPTIARNRLAVICLAALAALCLALPAAGSARGTQLVETWDAGVYDQAGKFDPTAGSHPFRAKTDFVLERQGTLPLESPRTVVIETPPGLVINPQAVPTCSRELLYWKECPAETRVGKVDLKGVIGTPYRVYNVEPRRGVPAEFAFFATAPPVFVQGQVTADGRVRAFIPDNSYGAPFQASYFEFFGVPADPVNGTGTNLTPKPLITTPTSCVGPVDTVLNINSYQDPEFERRVSTTPEGGKGCDELPFSPVPTVETTSHAAGAPTGLSFQVDVPQNDNPKGTATAHVKSVQVDLPQGMTVNPSAATGLAGCTVAQVNLTSTDPVACPNGSKIGSVEAETPLLKEEIGGSVYLATPYDNPFGTLLALYLVAENEERGVRLKIPGKVEVNPATGKLTASFDDNPQLPYESLRVRINGGDRAPLMNPAQCGTYPVITRIAPWSAADPDNPTAAETEVETSYLQVDSGCGAQGFAPQVQAGTEEALAGQTSPFVLSVSRADGQPEIASLTDIALPEGLLGYVSRAAQCPAAGADAGICPAASQIGQVQNAVGAGPSPAWLPQPGKAPTAVYLAGPYRGAPYSLSVSVPAQAGPFDLGRVVARAPLYVNPHTAQLSTSVTESRVYDRNGNLAQAIPGALPTIIDGIPLRLRAVRVLADRPGFMLNPTSCEPMAVTGNVLAAGSLQSPFAAHFQVGACRALEFSPKLKLQMKGATRRGGNPALKAVLTMPGGGQANIARTAVILPKSAFIDNDHISNPCTREQFADDACPPSSVVGHAKAYSPLLEEPLSGPVYFRANGGARELPDIVAALHGPVDLELVGFIDSVVNKKQGTSRVRNTFATVPDAPVSRFVLNMKGGKLGLIENSANLCRSNNRAKVKMKAHSGATSGSEPAISVPCAKHKKSGKKK